MSPFLSWFRKSKNLESNKNPHQKELLSRIQNKLRLVELVNRFYDNRRIDPWVMENFGAYTIVSSFLNEFGWKSDIDYKKFQSYLEIIQRYELLLGSSEYKLSFLTKYINKSEWIVGIGIEVLPSKYKHELKYFKQAIKWLDKIEYSHEESREIGHFIIDYFIQKESLDPVLSLILTECLLDIYSEVPNPSFEVIVSYGMIPKVGSEKYKEIITRLYREKGLEEFSKILKFASLYFYNNPPGDIEELTTGFYISEALKGELNKELIEFLRIHFPNPIELKKIYLECSELLEANETPMIPFIFLYDIFKEEVVSSEFQKRHVIKFLKKPNGSKVIIAFYPLLKKPKINIRFDDLNRIQRTVTTLHRIRPLLWSYVQHWNSIGPGVA